MGHRARRPGRGGRQSAGWSILRSHRGQVRPSLGAVRCAGERGLSCAAYQPAHGRLGHRRLVPGSGWAEHDAGRNCRLGAGPGPGPAAGGGLRLAGGSAVRVRPGRMHPVTSAATITRPETALGRSSHHLGLIDFALRPLDHTLLTRAAKTSNTRTNHLSRRTPGLPCSCRSRGASASPAHTGKCR